MSTPHAADRRSGRTARRWTSTARVSNCCNWAWGTPRRPWLTELSEAVKHDRPAHAVLDRLLAREVEARDERRIRTSLKLSNLPPGHDAGQLRLRLPAVDRAAADRDAGDLRVHPRARDAAGAGAARVSARRISCVGLGVKAIEQGFSVAFYRLEDLLHEMRKDAGVSPQRLRRKKYFNVSYLVVDEVGYRADEPGGRQPVLPAGELPLPPRQHGDHDEQGGQGLAGDPGGRRGDGGGDPGPAAAQERGAEHPGAELPAAGPGREPEGAVVSGVRVRGVLGRRATVLLGRGGPGGAVPGGGEGIEMA